MGGIYLIRDDELVEMSAEPYESEDLLQTLLAKFPSVLAGDQIGSTTRRWLLVSREIGVAGEEGGPDRWSLDHLFVDQDAVPTLVEVKRGDDSRIRRAVVGQMLDYAANGVVYWPTERLRGSFEHDCEEAGVDPAEKIASALGPETDPDAFWIAVDSNLRAGRVRLVFVSDEIPPELRRIIEFLNGQMTPAEVIGIEIKQYVGEGMRTLVPRVVGTTAGPPGSTGRKWTEEDLLEALKESGSTAVDVARALMEWARRSGLGERYGVGKVTGSWYPILDHDGRRYPPIAVWTSGEVGIPFYNLESKPPFDDPATRHDYAERLRAIPGVAIPADTGEQPLIPLTTFSSAEAMAALIDVLDWFLDRVRSIQPVPPRSAPG